MYYSAGIGPHTTPLYWAFFSSAEGHMYFGFLYSDTFVCDVHDRSPEPCDEPQRQPEKLEYEGKSSRARLKL